jgi:phosphonate metabolism-associated iron-containing alcohol dehydrogenase
MKYEEQCWQFHNPVSIFAGRGCRGELLNQIKRKRALVVTSQRGRRQIENDRILATLVKQCPLDWIDSISENPSLESMQNCIDDNAQTPFDIVIGFGGGSAIDAAKVINLALHPTCRGHRLAQLIEDPSLHANIQGRPLYVLPTTSGTGSEVTPFATVWNRTLKKKLSLASRAVFPFAAFVDSELTDCLPAAVTLSTGLDAINQAIESIWNKNANPITIAYATRAIKLGMISLPKLVKGEEKTKLRDQMAESSLLAGLAISHTRTALCHSISYPLTAHFGVPHGLACAFTMPAVLKHNLVADDGRFEQLALQLLGSTDVEKLIALFVQLNTDLKVREKVKKYIPDFKTFIGLSHEMNTPGRSENSLAKIQDISAILISAWGDSE